MVWLVGMDVVVAADLPFELGIALDLHLSFPHKIDVFALISPFNHSQLSCNLFFSDEFGELDEEGVGESTEDADLLQEGDVVLLPFHNLGQEDP